MLTLQQGVGSGLNLVDSMNYKMQYPFNTNHGQEVYEIRYCSTRLPAADGGRTVKSDSR